MIRVNLGPRGYDIATAGGPGLGGFVAGRVSGRRAFVVGDDNVTPHARRVVDELRRAAFEVAHTAIPAGEPSKSLEQAAALYAELADTAADRATVVVAVGGGVVGDLAGFVAATYNRGLPLVMVPTTLLAMVDSSVGGKVGINLPQGKNLVGAFHQPAGVWIDVAFLDTLPDREYRSGLAEVVKYGVALDAEFFSWLEANAAALLHRDRAAVIHAVTRSCQLKASIVEQDEHELTGVRPVLNYGHTFGHAFETAAGYGTWLHGEAVAAGMSCAANLAHRVGMLSCDDLQRQTRLLARFGLPPEPPAGHADEWLSIMRRDKKSVGGRLRLVLPRGIGSVEVVDDVDEVLVRAVLSHAARANFERK
jgi:3-dehydroquinate synthase